MKTIAEMKETVKTFLENNGFVQDAWWQKEVFLKTDKCERKDVERDGVLYNSKYTVTEIYGLCVHIDEVYRNNGTDANQSIEIRVVRWNGNSGGTVLREKLYARHGEKKTTSILTNVLEAYNA